MIIRMPTLMFGGSVAAIALSLVLAGPASAQNAAAPTDQAEDAESAPDIIVTGSSIRGAAPVGSNLVAVTTEDLAATGAQTVTGALAAVPSLSGTTGQGTTSAFYQPSIHQLGASASNSTLVLIDGHRGPTGGTNHTFLDPNIVPFNMLQRVDVLAEGASSVYGSDAVAGVINFITRKRFDGIQGDASVTFRNGQTGYQFGLLAGQSWDRGSVVFGATMIHQDNFANRDADWTYPDHTEDSVGNGLFGRNFFNSNCSPASINSTALREDCTTWGRTDLLGAQDRQNVMGKITFDATDNLTLGLDLLYARRREVSLGSAGSLSPASAFAPGSEGQTVGSGANAFQIQAGQTNPFYTGTGISQALRWDASDVFGLAKNRSDSDSMYAAFTASYKVSSNWTVDFLGSAGRDESSTFSEGAINTSAALLALNGTTNGAGNPFQPSIPGTTTVVRQNLTEDNALDLWNPAATNRTSAATRAAILDNTNMLRNTTGYQQARLSLNGSLFELPAGPMRVAIGGELYKTQLNQFVTRSNAGPARTNSQQLRFDFDRTVWSAFAELAVPVVSPEMEIPAVYKFDLSLAGRYDHYDDFGSTTNPKIAANWDIIEGLRLRGNWSTSFVAPPLTILGDEFGAFGTATWVPAANRNATVSTALFPSVIGLPGCNPGADFCSLNNLSGIQVTRGDPNAKAQEGDGWSVGVDLAPPLVPGLRASVTYWRTNFTGGVTGSQIEQVLGIPSANYLMTFYPNGATQAQIDAATAGIPQAGSLAADTYYIYQTLNTNWLNLKIGGIDYQLDYDLDTDAAGTFSVGVSGTEFLKYKQSFGNGEEYDILNTAGNNGTFASIKRRIRGYVGWANGPFNARVFANYTGSWRNWAGGASVNPIIRDENGNPESGGDKVKALTTFDLAMSYDFETGMMAGSKLSLAATNFLDKDPPFYNNSSGYYSLVHSPYGRTVTIALTMKFQ